MNFLLPDAWRGAVADRWAASSLDPLRSFLENEYKLGTVYPPADQIFTALELTPPRDVKAVILGQDPYHGARQAHGLAFSVRPGVRPPPSLGNILKELKSDLGVTVPAGWGDLSEWARQGVLLLNTTLTVREAQPLSHRGQGWESFTDSIIATASTGVQPVVFVLWGAHAQKKLPLVDVARHEVIQSAHPSPLSARNGFFGSKPFSRINEALRRFGRREINWDLTPGQN